MKQMNNTKAKIKIFKILLAILAASNISGGSALGIVYASHGLGIPPNSAIYDETAEIRRLFFRIRQTTPPNFGGQRDSYGCLIGAGYQFDPLVRACVRPGQLNLEQRNSARTAINFIGPAYGLTIVDLLVARCPGCFDLKVEYFGNYINIRMENWEVTSAWIYAGDRS